MSVLRSNFCQKSYNAVILPSYDRVDKVLDDGTTLVEFVPSDFKELIEENGVFTDWSLQSLMNSGVDPRSITPHISTTTRLEGTQQVDSMLDNLQQRVDTEIASSSNPISESVVEESELTE